MTTYYNIIIAIMDSNINSVYIGTTNTINIMNNNLIHCLRVFYKLAFILFYYKYNYLHL
jgi:hypothetical protein